MEFLKWNSSILRITINRVKSQTKVWAKIFANHLSDQGLISKICNKLLQLNNKELGDEENRWEIGCCLVALSCPTLFDPVDCSTPGFPVLHYLLKCAQTHISRISDVIQPSHPLSPPSSALNLSQHQGLYQWVSSSHQELQLQLQFFQWIFRVDFL